MKIKMPHFFRHYGSLKVLILVVILMMLLTHGIKGLKQNADVQQGLTVYSDIENAENKINIKKGNQFD